MALCPQWASACAGKVVLDNVPERFPFFGSSTDPSHRGLFNHYPQGPGLDQSPWSAYDIRSERSACALSLVRQVALASNIPIQEDLST